MPILLAVCKDARSPSAASSLGFSVFRAYGVGAFSFFFGMCFRSLGFLCLGFDCFFRFREDNLSAQGRPNMKPTNYKRHMTVTSSGLLAATHDRASVRM